MSEAREHKRRGSDDNGAGPTRSFDPSEAGPGGQIGPFRIERELGRGAVGVVYLAHDTKLDRLVAIKSLPTEVMANPKVRLRFSREARLLASLNHPNIATIYDEFQETEDVAYLILEYVPGQTLAERIAKGGFGLEESLSTALQIAEAVAAAHEHDVIHRDLKPGNIKITPEGKVKVLDFGLAKAVGGEAADQQSTVTEPGRVIGTPAYMSPEQARGKTMDKRSDIWAFGCVLYEMLAAKIPFKGETISDTLANILQTEPNWQALPEDTPSNIRSLLRRCLEKDPHKRLRDIGDAGIEIRETLSPPAIAISEDISPEVAVKTVTLRRVMAYGVVCLLLGAIMATVITWRMNRSTPKPLAQFPISLLPNQTLVPHIAVSPDGRRLVYVGRVGDTRRLYLREPDQLTARELPETEGAKYPFFSPDGQSIGFGDGDTLKILSLDGSKPETLCHTSAFMGGCWGPDGTVYFVPYATSGIWRISVDERESEVLTSPKEHEFCHWWPEVLPGGEALLFTIWTSDDGDFGVAVLSLSSGNWKTLLKKGASHARYAPTGHLLFGKYGGLWAAPFDLKQLKLGEPSRVVESINQSIYNGYVPFCFSDDGMLCYVRGGLWLARNQLVWVNRQGDVVGSLEESPATAYMHPQLSPDEEKVAFTVFEGGTQQVCLYDLPSGPSTKLTSKSHNYLPLWVPPDGDRLAFSTWRKGPSNVYRMPANIGGIEELLVGGPNDKNEKVATSWSPDGKKLLYNESSSTSGEDIFMLSIEDGNTPEPLLQEAWAERNAVFSPDGNWVAYQSNREGSEEVYVVSYQERVRKKISRSGGCNPVWSKDGKELFYRNGNKMMRVSIETEPELEPGTPEVLFDEKLLIVDADIWGWGRNYDVSGDGQRFLMVKQDEEQPATNQLVVVLNWFEELRHLVPIGNDR